MFKENICHQAVFYRRSIFECVGDYSLHYPIWADWELNIRCFRHPAIRALWIDRVIAIYNDQAGVSKVQDPVFRRELPVTLLHDMSHILASRSYCIGKALFGWLDK